MKIKLGYSMGYAGTDSEWTEEIPEATVKEGDAAIEAYLEGVRNNLYEEASQKISIWVGIVEESE
jgi:hypothetical protein